MVLALDSSQLKKCLAFQFMWIVVRYRPKLAKFASLTQLPRLGAKKYCENSLGS